jgi:hypothetical protein
MFKNFVFASVIAVAASKGLFGWTKKGKRSDSNKQEDHEDLDCKPFMELNDAGECVFAALYAPMCKPEDVLDACMCSSSLEGAEAYAPRCNPQYTLNDECMCEGNAECTAVPEKCEKGQYFDIWECGCLEWPVCEVECAEGLVAHKLTCECVEKPEKPESKKPKHDKGEKDSLGDEADEVDEDEEPKKPEGKKPKHDKVENDSLGDEVDEVDEDHPPRDETEENHPKKPKNGEKRGKGSQEGGKGGKKDTRGN